MYSLSQSRRVSRRHKNACYVVLDDLASTAGTGEPRVGRRAESFRGRELTDNEKVPVLRAYLKRWKFEAGSFFDGLDPDAPDEQLRAKTATFRERFAKGETLDDLMPEAFAQVIENDGHQPLLCLRGPV